MIYQEQTPPQLTLTVPEIEGLLEQVQQYHEIYSPLFQRREQRERSATYLYGLLSPEVTDKAIEPMMLKLCGDDPNSIRAMQHFISAGAWEDDPLLTHHWREVNQDLGDEAGIYLFDGSDFAKQGPKSAGVKRQHCGELGKIANCQAGVFMGYVSPKGYALLDRRLYLPEEWVQDDAFAALRCACAVPDTVVFQTKPALALEMLRAVR
ncbi:MAG: transposase [Chloroflexi bacterium]|nr:transposase [Chloroflexota bacterium]